MVCPDAYRIFLVTSKLIFRVSLVTLFTNIVFIFSLFLPIYAAFILILFDIYLWSGIWIFIFQLRRQLTLDDPEKKSPVQ